MKTPCERLMEAQQELKLKCKEEYEKVKAAEEACSTAIAKHKKEYDELVAQIEAEGFAGKF